MSGEITPAQGQTIGTAVHPAGHSGTGGAWAAVGLMIVGFTLAAVAVPMQSWPVEGVGLGIGAIGMIVGKLVGLMSQVH